MTESIRYRIALRALQDACSRVSSAAEAISVVDDHGLDSADTAAALDAIASCRASLLIALGHSPELRDVFVVPAIARK